MPLVFRILAMQGAVAAMLTMTFLMMAGRPQAVSALLGAVVVIVPSLGSLGG